MYKTKTKKFKFISFFFHELDFINFPFIERVENQCLIAASIYNINKQSH